MVLFAPDALANQCFGNGRGELVTVMAVDELSIMSDAAMPPAQVYRLRSMTNMSSLTSMLGKSSMKPGKFSQ
jgi:hypothetical protein